MNNKTPSVSVVASRSLLRYWLPLSLLLLYSNAWADCEGGHNIPITCSTPPPVCSYAAKPSTSIMPAEEIGVTGAAGNVYWELAPSAGCSAGTSSITCLGMVVTLPTGAPSESVAQTAKVTLGGTAQAGIGESQFTLTVTDAGNTSNTCSRTYNPHVTSSGGGWGDPHITTVDGVHYDFQSAGEFIALRGGGLEIQTRQTPVATATVPGANAYTGLASCVSIYTAFAARIGTHRVSYQPNISGVPDPSGMQLRIDGVLTNLGPNGISLGSGGGAPPPSATGAVVQPSGDRIVKTAVGDGIEVHYANGTKVVVTSAWWQSQQKWYLNVNAYDTAATEGIMGRIAPGSWLPALANGTALGPKPEPVHDRYMALYETFADSWRVTNATSLFDYAPATTTANFTLDSWPKESPKDCTIPQEPVAQPVDVAVAEQQCSDVVDANTKANCVFDVAVTGHTGFAQTYVVTQQLAPGATKTTVIADKAASKQGESVTFTATVERAVPHAGGALAGTVQFVLDGANVGGPVALDVTGKAVWNAAGLVVGVHQVMAKYSGSSGFGEQFLASTSPAVSHTVAASAGMPLWLIILLIIILLIAIIWWLLRGR